MYNYDSIIYKLTKIVLFRIDNIFKKIYNYNHETMKILEISVYKFLSHKILNIYLYLMI